MKDSTDKKETRKVILVAYTYEWTCPNCQETNSTERTSHVTCDYCEHEYDVSEIGTA